MVEDELMDRGGCFGLVFLPADGFLEAVLSVERILKAWTSGTEMSLDWHWLHYFIKRHFGPRFNQEKIVLVGLMLLSIRMIKINSFRWKST